METFSALLSLSAGDLPVTDGFPSPMDSNTDLWYFLGEPKHTAEQTLDWQVIWDAMTVIWRGENA